MFLSNKYSKYYYNIVARAKSRTLAHGTYVEKHHVIPRSLGGSNEPENIVKLTAKEHLICHRLLIRMTTGIQKSKMAFAAWRMVFSSSKHKRFKVTARVYESIKIEMSKAAKERSKSYRHSTESKQKIAESKLGKPRAVTWGEKISEANTGKKKTPLTAETKEKISQSLTGRKMGPISESHRQKVSDSKKGKKIQVDPVTGRRFYQ
jgi:hypothetical protein